jgi:FixJ family two-component response regulator
VIDVDYSIAIVEDNAVLGKYLLEALGGDFNADYYDSPAKFLEDDGLGKGYNCIVLDKDMPEMTGVELAMMIREKCDDSTKIYIITGDPDDAIQDAIKGNYVNGFLPKPFRKKDILDLIQF